jgi:RNA polymerase sigma factor (sigma-70 family)
MITKSPPRARTRSRALTPEAEAALAARIRTGDGSAREALILANIGLAVEIARRFRSPGMATDDLLQEAMLGLVRAADRFDPETHRCRFSSYAVHWIKKYIHRALIENRSLVRIPSYLYRLGKKIERLEAEARCAGDPDAGKVASGLGIDPRRAEYLARAMIRPIATGADPDGDGMPLEQLAADDDPADREEERAEAVASVYAALDRLTPFEAWVIRCRFGLADEHDLLRTSRPSPPPAVSPEDRETDEAQKPDGDEVYERGGMSYAWVGRACGLSGRQVRRVEYLAMQKLRAYLDP